MATVTGPTVAPIVGIILSMTTKAVGRDVYLVPDRLPMTRIAVNFGMGSVERKVRFFVVIEHPRFPVSAVVAERAMGSLAFLVHIVLLMTGVADALGILERRGAMTFLA